MNDVETAKKHLEIINNLIDDQVATRELIEREIARKLAVAEPEDKVVYKNAHTGNWHNGYLKKYDWSPNTGMTYYVIGADKNWEVNRKFSRYSHVVKPDVVGRDGKSDEITKAEVS